MTLISPDVDVDDITHLDFAPPCCIKSCDIEATWIAIYRGIPPCCPSSYLLCGHHLDHIRDALKRDLILICPHGLIGPIRKHLDRIEPL